MAKLDDELVVEEREEDRVFMWRYEVLLRAGVDDDHASAVAASEFDLHRACRMIDAGCDSASLAAIAT